MQQEASAQWEKRAFGPFACLGRNGAPARLGILGGTFDPIHLGHLNCADAACIQLGLSGVLLMPAAVPVYKKDQRVTPAHVRLELCRLAAENDSRFQASALEIDRGGDTYTAHTLQVMRDFFPENVELVFIAGSDAAITIPKWRDSETIARLAHIAVVARPGWQFPKGMSPETLDGRFRCTLVQAPQLDVASSSVRMRCAKGESFRYTVPEAVYGYIRENHLYEQEAQ